MVEQFMVEGERGGRGSQTMPVMIEKPVLVPMSAAERAAAVSVLAEILTAWWTDHGSEERDRRIERRSAKPSSTHFAASAFYAVTMFTLEQITDIHDRLGNRDTLRGYLKALRDIGVETYDSYITDGHSEYFGADGQQLVGPAFHETFAIAETCDKERFLQYMQQVEQGGVGYVEMSKALADNGVEKSLSVGTAVPWVCGSVAVRCRTS